MAHLCTLTRASLGRLDPGACAALARASLGRLREPIEQPATGKGGYKGNRVERVKDDTDRKARDKREYEAERRAAVERAFNEAFGLNPPDLAQPLPEATRKQVAQVARQDMAPVLAAQAEIGDMLALIDAMWLEMQDDEAIALLLLM